MMSPKVKYLRFDPIPHKYSDEDGNPYTSVTTKVEEYKKPFDRKYWSEYKAYERGVPASVILDEWDKITKDSQDKGNYVHEENLENSINEAIGRLANTGGCNYSANPVWGYELNLQVLSGTRLAIKYPEIFACIEYYVSRGWKIYAEKRVYLWEYLIAGTIDLLLVKGNDFIIVDWKTNKDELKFKSGYYKKVNGIKTNIWVDKDERMLAPLDHLQHCKGNGYIMQLSTYAYLCEAWGYKCVGIILYHIHEPNIEFARSLIRPVHPPVCYEIPYWKKEVHMMLNHKPVYHNAHILA